MPKTKAYVIPFYKSERDNCVYAYLFIKRLTNPYSKPVMKDRRDGFKLGSNKLWFAGGCPYPFGGNVMYKTFDIDLQKELTEESHGKVTIDDFKDWSIVQNQNWRKYRLHKEIFTEGRDYHHYLMLELKARLPSGVIEVLAEDRQQIQARESTGIIVEVRLHPDSSIDTILEQIGRDYRLGRDRRSEDRVDDELESCCLGDFSEPDRAAARAFFNARFEEWIPETQFKESHTLEILSELFNLVNPPHVVAMTPAYATACAARARDGILLSKGDSPTSKDDPSAPPKLR